jgi:predicted ATPase
VTDAAVTYLFSDVEGSTRLWETEPERIGPALARHDALARRCVEQHGGRVVKTTGDGLHAAFDDPAAAVAAAVQLQLEVCHPPAGVLPLALRCGLHLGVDQRRDGDYFGPAVNRAARVMSAAHGGQVLLSQAVVERVADRLPPDLSLRDLGIVRLRDLTQPDRLFQLVHPRLRSEFPALRSLASTPNNLPQQLNSFVGRERELDEVKTLLGQHRLVTLLAMGGIGKSRLSVQLGAEVLDDFPDGVWLVELAPLTDPGAVPQAVASVLGVKEEAGGAVIDALLRFVRDRCLLVILDNCEHLVDAAADLAKRLLQAGPRVTVLATSRDGLQVTGEHSYALQTLSVPQAHGTVDAEALTRHEAVRLFVDRASAAQPAFRLTPSNAAAVAMICQQLDGIPLALELAAARTRTLPVEAIAARLDDRFRLLTTQDRTVLPRQRTLRALIDWSYDMLPPPERALFERLSVFAGGWTLEAAEAVGAGGQIDALDVIDLLARLVEKSLATIDVESGRYRMLDTVRHYAAERLAQSGDEPATRERHLAHFAALVEHARTRLFGSDQARFLAQLDEERDNTLAAHAWCASSPQGAAFDLQLVYGLKFYWLNRGLLDLGLRVAKEALGRMGAEQRTLARSRGLSDAGQISYFMGRYDEARVLLEESLGIARGLGNPLRLVAVLQILSMVEFALGDAAQAQAHGEEALRLARDAAQPHVVAGTLNNLAQLHRARGAPAEALPLYAEALGIARSLGDQETIAIALLNRAMAQIDGGEPEAAQPSLEEAMTISSATGSRALGQSLLEVSAGLAAARGDWAACATLYGAAEAQAQRSGIRRDPADAVFLATAIQRSRAAHAGSAAAEAQGRSMEYDDAMVAVRSFLLAAAVAG